MGWHVTVYGITCIIESLSAYQVTILLRGAYSIVTHQIVNDTSVFIDFPSVSKHQASEETVLI